MKKLLTLFFVLVFSIIFFMFSFVLLIIISDNISNYISVLIRDDFYILWTGLTIIFILFYLFLCYKSNQSFNAISAKLLIVFCPSCLVAFFIAFVFGNSPYWFVKYTVGFFVGILFYLFSKKQKIKRASISSGIVSLFVLLFCEQAEYFLIMDPSGYPSILTIKSFPHIVLWLGTILFVFFSSYFFSKGFWKKGINN